jgi:anti-sigma factor RsiW
MKTYTQTPTTDQVEALVLRRLRGDLEATEVARLEAALAADPRLAAHAAGLERAWRGLELAPVAGGDSVAPQVLARLRAERAGEAGFGRSPAWARVAAAMALVAGLGTGFNLDWGLEPPVSAAPEIVRNGDEIFEQEASFAESLWLAAESDPLDDGEVQ